MNDTVCGAPVYTAVRQDVVTQRVRDVNANCVNYTVVNCCDSGDRTVTLHIQFFTMTSRQDPEELSTSFF